MVVVTDPAQSIRTFAPRPDCYIYQGNCRDVLQRLPAESVHCVVTSPPYWGLRDYGVDGQIGLESTYQSYVSELVDVFREVRRVLRPDGTLWLNLGDSYAATTTKGAGGTGKQHSNSGSVMQDRSWKIPADLKPKDLVGIPWRVAFALQADGWWLRQDIIWSKPNPMPESVTDRCTKAHEYLFLLTKGERYHFDAEAIKEPATGTDDRPQRRRAIQLASDANLTPEHFAAIRACGVTDTGKAQTTQDGYGKNNDSVQMLADKAKEVLGGYYREFLMASTRNKRSVWNIAPKPFRGAHFATFPPDLVRPCILAGCPAGGVVLDPFFGAGTTGVVACELGRNAIGIELNPDYVAMAATRVAC